MRKQRRYIKAFLSGIIIVLIFSFGVNIVSKMLYPLRYEEYITKYSNEYDLDKYLVMSLIKAESNYIYDAHSGVARGLMQITDETGLWIAVKLGIEFQYNLEDPETNIRMGCFYLKYLLDYYNDNSQLALAAYNAGMGNVDKWLADEKYSKSGTGLHDIPFEETKKYIEKVNDGIKIYKKLYGKQEEKL